MGAKKKSIVKLRGTLPYRVVPDDDWFIAKCELLHVNGQGKTPNSAIRHLRDAVVGFLLISYEDGTIDEILKECGFHAIRLGEELVWASSSGLDQNLRYAILKFSSKIQVKASPDIPSRGENLPTNDFPWVVAVPGTSQPSRAA